jgi:hypothetical protein
MSYAPENEVEAEYTEGQAPQEAAELAPEGEKTDIRAIERDTGKRCDDD